ncbi:winged helix DNA-binding domain-containing protein [Paenibacillus sp. DMB20]|uniref:winged helix DNA-binding domain-containing protein n=1 Tax=Paenibacillus sp. DMB20 TaxID=1642570 RepID=UPI0006275F4A|nr:winged helix DNA-binding domain-containing protein [Paenibacillus sp. DMB20]KKO54094.1 hypothetical protein XI25_08395 [Paenibacillus sp. DMB20]
MKTAKKTPPDNEDNGRKKANTENVLGRRELNRALLARQMLLSRMSLPALDAIEHLAGLQAQSPNAPYFALWTRLNGFAQDELSRLIRSKKAVRIALMRSTLHLVSAADCLTMRPWVQSVLERSLNGAFGKKLEGLDPLQLASAGRTCLGTEPLALHEIGKRLNVAWPAHEPAALAAAVRSLVPLVQVPPRGLWGESGQAVHASAEAWLGRSLSAEPDETGFIKRYLTAYGPATIKDMQAWSGLPRLRETFGKLRPQLAIFHDEQGNELFDLPGAPRPDADTPSPPRFLGEFDNVLLSHADRSRILDDKYRKRVITKNGIVRSTFLIDGFVSGTWKIVRERKKAVLCLETFKRLTPRELNDLTAEGLQLLHFAAGDEDDKDIAFTLAE